MIFVRGENSVQDVIPRVIKNGLVVCEICVRQDRVIGATDVIETELEENSASGSIRIPPFEAVGVFREHARAREKGEEVDVGPGFGIQSETVSGKKRRNWTSPGAEKRRGNWEGGLRDKTYWNADGVNSGLS